MHAGGVWLFVDAWEACLCLLLTLFFLYTLIRLYIIDMHFKSCRMWFNLISISLLHNIPCLCVHCKHTSIQSVLLQNINVFLYIISQVPEILFYLKSLAKLAKADRLTHQHPTTRVA